MNGPEEDAMKISNKRKAEIKRNHDTVMHDPKLKVKLAVIETIYELGQDGDPIPLGPIYAALMDQRVGLSFHEFMTLIAALKTAGLIQGSAESVRWTGPVFCLHKDAMHGPCILPKGHQGPHEEVRR